MADREIAHQGFEYRVQGGELHRRPLNREGLTPWQAAWVVMGTDPDFVPAVVRQQFSQPSGLHFD